VMDRFATRFSAAVAFVGMVVMFAHGVRLG
jgi:hypothetical protein